MLLKTSTGGNLIFFCATSSTSAGSECRLNFLHIFCNLFTFHFFFTPVPNGARHFLAYRLDSTRHTNDCITWGRLSKIVVPEFTWSRNVGKSETKHPIEPHFSQHFPSCPKLCTCRTFPVLYPKFVVGAHGNDLLEVDSTQVLSSPSVRQVNLQCKFPIHFHFRPSEKHGVTQLYKPKWARQNCTQNPSEVNHEEASRATCHQLSLWKNSEEKFVKMSSQRVDGRPRFLWGLQANSTPNSSGDSRKQI